MARTSTYLNFPGNTEAVFNFYKAVLVVISEGLLPALAICNQLMEAPPYRSRIGTL